MRPQAVVASYNPVGDALNSDRFSVAPAPQVATLTLDFPVVASTTSAVLALVGSVVGAIA